MNRDLLPAQGIAFVNFAKYEDAQEAILKMHGYQLGDKYLSVSFKNSRR
jgi:RNA recognition motif-containing protein